MKLVLPTMTEEEILERVRSSGEVGVSAREIARRAPRQLKHVMMVLARHRHLVRSSWRPYAGPGPVQEAVYRWRSIPTETAPQPAGKPATIRVKPVRAARLVVRRRAER